jgi:2-desacetyl-2-hydroxyethyl bacteriochlorophyllide A dehydrogenase
MKAIVVKRPNDFGLQDVEDPVPSPDDVEMKVLMTGICGTDLSIIRGRNPAIPYPIIPGHECVAEVLRAPENSKLNIGDRVTVFPSVGCGKCEACKSGRIPHCPEAKTVGVLRPGGYFAERIIAHHERVLLLPREMENEVGAMIEPTAVAVHSNRRGGVGKGTKLVVIGGGPIGLLHAQVARAYGASPLVISEPIAERRALADRMGFELICNPREEELVSFVRKNMGMPDVVFDVVATEKTLTDSTEMLRPDGLLVTVALPHGEKLGIPYRNVFQKELRVVGTRTYFFQDFPEAISLLHSHQIEVRPLLGKILPLERFGEGIELLEKQPERYFKILISPGMTSLR